MWKPKVLREFEIGRVVSAIEEISIRGTPITEVSGIRAKKADLLYDLNACIRLAGCRGKVFPWIQNMGMKKWKSMHRYRYGFYSHPCMLDALKYMDSHRIDPILRHVFLGLLFGYRSDSIQKFVTEKKGRKKKPR